MKSTVLSLTVHSVYRRFERMRHFNDNAVTSRVNLSMAVNTTCVSCMNLHELLLGCAMLTVSFLLNSYIHLKMHCIIHIMCVIY